MIKTIQRFVLNWIWQLPQHLLGLILIAVTRSKYTRTIERDGVYTGCTIIPANPCGVFR